MTVLRPGDELSKLVARAAGRIALGLSLVLIDFRLEGFDLFPDVLGYGLLILALGDLRPIEQPARAAGLYALAVLGSWTSALISLGSCFAHPPWSSAVALILGAIETGTALCVLALMAITCTEAGMPSAAACWRRAAWVWAFLSVIPLLVVVAGNRMFTRSDLSSLACPILGLAIVEVCLLVHASKETRNSLGTRECAKCRLRIGFDPDQVCPTCQLCPRCGYDVASIPADICPECGSRLARKQAG